MGSAPDIHGILKYAMDFGAFSFKTVWPTTVLAKADAVIVALGQLILKMKIRVMGSTKPEKLVMCEADD